MGDHRGKNVQCFSCPISPITGHEAPIPAVSTVWLVGRGDGLTALVPYPAVSRKGTFVSLDPGLMGLAASIPYDLGGMARRRLSRSFVSSCPSICILDNGDCGPDGSYPLDRSGTAQWLLSRGRLLILVLIRVP